MIGDPRDRAMALRRQPPGGMGGGMGGPAMGGGMEPGMGPQGMRPGMEPGMGPQGMRPGMEPGMGPQGMEGGPGAGNEIVEAGNEIVQMFAQDPSQENLWAALAVMESLQKLVMPVLEGMGIMGGGPEEGLPAGEGAAAGGGPESFTEAAPTLPRF